MVSELLYVRLLAPLSIVAAHILLVSGRDLGHTGVLVAVRGDQYLGGLHVFSHANLNLQPRARITRYD